MTKKKKTNTNIIIIIIIIIVIEGMIGPVVCVYIYIYIYWAVDHVREHLVVQGRVNVITDVCISE